MMWVDFELEKSLSLQVIHNSLNILAISAEISRQPSDRLRSFRSNNRSEDLPACAR